MFIFMFGLDLLPLNRSTCTADFGNLNMSKSQILIKYPAQKFSELYFIANDQDKQNQYSVIPAANSLKSNIKPVTTANNSAKSVKAFKVKSLVNTKSTLPKVNQSGHKLANPGIVQGSNVNNFINSGNMFTKDSINQFNNLDRGAPVKQQKGVFSKLRHGFKHMTKDMAKEF